MLRGTLKEISSQIARMESRVKRAFPAPAKRVEERQRSRSLRVQNEAAPSLSSDEALREFDKAVQLASANPEQAERFLSEKRPEDLATIARELGISFGKSKPSVKAIKDAVFGRIRESLLLSRHHTNHRSSTA